MADQEDYIDFDEKEEPAQKQQEVVKAGTFATMHTTSFKDFLLREELQKRIQSFGFEHPSEVQQQCLPNSLLGLDVLCQAKAGMGKTAVFILTVLNRMLEGNIKGERCCLVLAHTRELAFQISKEFTSFSEGLGYKIVLLIGGEDMNKQIEELKNKPHIMIGTPGRVLGLIRRKKLDLENVQAFIIDECDKMLSAAGKFPLVLITNSHLIKCFMKFRKKFHDVYSS